MDSSGRDVCPRCGLPRRPVDICRGDGGAEPECDHFVLRGDLRRDREASHLRPL